MNVTIQQDPGYPPRQQHWRHVIDEHLRVREVKGIAQGHTDGGWQNQDSNLGLSDSSLWHFEAVYQAQSKDSLNVHYYLLPNVSSVSMRTEHVCCFGVLFFF